MAIQSSRGAFNLRLAVIFLVVALLAAFFGFSGLTTGIAQPARVVFFIFLVGFAVQLVIEISRHPPP